MYYEREFGSSRDSKRFSLSWNPARILKRHAGAFSLRSGRSDVHIKSGESEKIKENEIQLTAFEGGTRHRRFEAVMRLLLQAIVTNGKAGKCGAGD